MEIQNNQNTEIALDILYLIACVLHDEKPDVSKVNGMNLKAIYDLARRHSIESLVYAAIQGLQLEGMIEEERELVDKWKQQSSKALYRMTMFDIEREAILDFMENQGIWYMPLKGLVLRKFYPKPEMRQMADNDILYDKQYQKELRTHMKSMGYKDIKVGVDCEDVYQKEPIFNFEMHSALMFSKEQPLETKYYANIKERLLVDEGKQFGYHFSDEDFYIYMLAHEYKHYKAAGTGIRSLIDSYLYLKNKESSMDWEYINSELKKLNLTEFEQINRCLSQKLFADSSNDYETRLQEVWNQQYVNGQVPVDRNDNDALTQREAEMLAMVLGAGTYGNDRIRVKNRMEKIGSQDGKVTNWIRIKYYWKRVFPTIEFLERKYPIVHRHRWMIPFAYVFRIISQPFIRPKQLIAEFRQVWGKDRKK